MTPAVIFDLEFTAWPGSMDHDRLRPGEFREVVQIAAFDALVRPRLNPVLPPSRSR